MIFHYRQLGEGDEAAGSVQNNAGSAQQEKWTRHCGMM